MRAASPEAAEVEIARFRPHLLVHGDTAPVSRATLEGVPWRVEVLYSDGMDARLSADGRTTEMRDASTGDLLRAVDAASPSAGAEAAAEAGARARSGTV